MPTRLEKYTAQFADRLLDAIEKGTAPWQKPCPPYRESRSRPLRS